MKSTIRTDSGVITISAEPGRVLSNGAVMLPHEAALVALALNRAAERANDLARDALCDAVGPSMFHAASKALNEMNGAG